MINVILSAVRIYGRGGGGLWVCGSAHKSESSCRKSLLSAIFSDVRATREGSDTKEMETRPPLSCCLFLALQRSPWSPFVPNTRHTLISNFIQKRNEQEELARLVGFEYLATCTQRAWASLMTFSLNTIVERPGVQVGRWQARTVAFFPAPFII
jgi:hypothetical protein